VRFSNVISSYSCAAVDYVSTDIVHRAISAISKLFVVKVKGGAVKPECWSAFVRKVSNIQASIVTSDGRCDL